MRSCSLLLPILLAGFVPTAGARAQPEPAGGPAAAPAHLRFDHIPLDQFNGITSAILQDRRGFMWFAGIYQGLFRFDGYAMEYFTFDPEDPQSLPPSIITDVVEARNGILWVATQDGLNRFDPETGTATHYRVATGRSESVGPNRLYALIEDRQGLLWLETQHGLHRFDPETETFTAFRYGEDRADAQPGGPIRAVLEDHRGRIWVGNWGLNRFDPVTGSFTRYLPHPDIPHPRGAGRAAQKNMVFSLFEDSRNRLWVGTWSGAVYRFDPETGAFTPYRADQDPEGRSAAVVGLAEDPINGLWMASDQAGLTWLDPETGTLRPFSHDPADPHSLPSGQATAVYADRQGGIWVGVGGGLTHFDRAAGTFDLLYEKPNVSNSLQLNGSGAFGMYDGPDGILWVTSRDRRLLNRIDRRHQRYQHFAHDPGDPRSLSAEGAQALVVGRDGTVWTGGDQLNRMDPGRPGVFTRYAHDPEEANSLAPGFINSLFEDAAGALWVGHDQGMLTRVTSGSDPVFTRFVVDPETGMINSFYEDGDGIFWLGTQPKGLYRFDPTTGQAVNYPPPPMPGAGRFNAQVEGVCGRPEAPDIVWVASYRIGLQRFDKRDETFTLFTMQNSDLPDNGVQGLLCDEALWISTDVGLSRYDPETGVFTNYETDDGLQGAVFYDSAYHQSPYTGEMFFGGVGGINSFFPEAIRDNPYPPVVVLTGLQLFDRPVSVGNDSPLVRPYADAEEITLAHRENDLTFDYVGLHYTDAAENQYAYRLEPYDADWRYVGTRRSALFTNLDPGTYTFRVKAANSDGVWSAADTTVRVVIRLPWWRTAWAYVLYGLLFVAGVVGAGRLQRRRILRQARQRAQVEQAEMKAAVLQTLDRDKSRFFANVSHEFRTPLTLILGPLEDLQDGLYGPLSQHARQLLDTAIGNGRRLLRLVNQLLDVSRLESGKLTLQARPLDVGPFVERIARAFTPMAERKRIAFRLDLPGEPVTAYVDPEQFEKVLTNLLGNAFKFTPETGTVRLSAATQDETLVVSVQDTGPGIAPEHQARLFERFYQADASSTRRQPGTGIGLALVKSLVDLHHGSIQVESQVGQGSTFTVRLPLGAAHLSDEERAEASDDGGFTERFEALLDQEEPALWATATRETDAFDQEDGGTEDATTVLVVDDHPEVRAYVARHLRRHYRVLEAADGRDALAQARSHVPDLIVSDVMMPEMDGYALCRAVKQDPALDFIPVILLTAKASSDSKMAGLAEGADDYLSKPFNVRELLVRVENLIALRQRLKARISAWTGRENAGNGLPSLHAAVIEVKGEDAVFWGRVGEVIERRLSDETFGVSGLASALGVGRTTLYRRLGALVEEKPMDLIWRMRLERAAQLLRGKVGNVSEIAYAVGFKSVAHFCDRFQAHYGTTPATYAAGRDTPSLE